MLHDGAEDRRLQVLPLRTILGYGDEVVAEEDTGHAGNGEQARGQRRGLGSTRRIAEIGSTFQKNLPAGKEFQRSRVGGRLGLDKHERLRALAGHSVWNNSK